MPTTPQPGLVIETTDLTKRFGKRAAVDRVDLIVPAGCAFGLLGPNGAGKTTLIRVLVGLTRADAGSVVVMGHAVPDERAAALSSVGAIIEEPRFHGHLSGRENLRIIAAAINAAAMARIPELLARVDLSAHADARVRTYSLGMRQRLGIARCLLGDPRLLILDEPMNGLDPAGIQSIRTLVGTLVAEGRTVVISSHLLDEIERTCDRVAILDQGRLIRAGLVAEIRGEGMHRLTINCSDPARATGLLQAHPAVAGVAPGAGSALVLTMSSADASAAVNRMLVEAGIDVSLLMPQAASLEDRFLDITTGLGGTSGGAA